MVLFLQDAVLSLVSKILIEQMLVFAGFEHMPNTETPSSKISQSQRRA